LADELQNDYILRLTDIRPLSEIAAENRPQGPLAPVARPFPPPHENRVVDVCDPAAVSAACEGMDAVINLSVVREDIVGAFGVNLLGAYNIIKAAAAHGIRRVVHTGPQLLTVSRETGYHYEHPVSGDAPARPGRWVYTHSKYLAQEVVRIFTEHHGLSVPCLLFNGFVSNGTPHWGDVSFLTTWADSARALRAALETESLPSPFEVIHISADLPQGGVSPQRAHELLGWRTQDDMARTYKKSAD
jgi:nucleoside-diphosphate-sugar epimerase